MTLTVLIKKLIGYVVKPLQVNAPFFVTMYILAWFVRGYASPIAQAKRFTGIFTPNCW